MNKNNENAIKGIDSGSRIGIFGGTFNPLHMGHLNCISTVHTRLHLDKVIVVPAAQNPKKPVVEGPTSEQRLEMLKIGVSDYAYVDVDDQELKRGGMSYTIDTIRSYREQVAAENLYLIVGLDQFEEFDTWKDYEQILELANLIVVTRPNHSLPFTEDDMPAGLKKLVAVFDRQFVALTTGRSIEFLRLQDVDVSSSDVRKRLRTGRNVDRHITIEVEDYVRQHNLYGPLGPRIGDFEKFTNFCAQALFARKAINVRGFDLRAIESPTEFTLIASGTSTRHTSSLAEAVAKAVKEEFNVFPQSLEGIGEGRWVVLDYGSLIVHVFYDFVRQEYRLEDLWRHGRDLQIKDETPVPQQQSVPQQK
jgi:nicotinate-nucleotide adenylyltransferase